MNSPEVKNLLKICDGFRAGQVDLRALHEAMLSVMETIQEPSREELKNAIEWAEEELGLLQVTSLSLQSDALRVLDKLEARMRKPKE